MEFLTGIGASGVYLGNGWVITAAHVGMGSFSLDSVNYPAVANSAIDGNDNSDMVNLGTYPIEETIPAQAVPEPSSFALLASGALLCLAVVKLKSMKLPASAT